MRAELGGDIGQQPLPPDQPIFQVRTDRREPKLDHPTGDPLLGMAASLLLAALTLARLATAFPSRRA